MLVSVGAVIIRRTDEEKTNPANPYPKLREVDMRKYGIAFVLAVLCLSALCATSEAQEWAQGASGDGNLLYAATIDEAGPLLGQYCYLDTGSCLYVLSMGTTCSPEAEYPALVNSDVGSVHVSLLCSEKYNDENILFVDSFDDIDRIVRSANQVGFAVAMENGDLNVVRFSLRGAAWTIDLMRDRAAKIMKGNPRNRSRPAEERY